MHPSVRTITQRLSLRPPQRESLEILDEVFAATHMPKHDLDLADLLQAVQARYSSVEDFEREFPSLCFSLATGVGKTRLMGAMITYLHVAHGLRNFFVLAPNLTIYEKLVADFTPNTPKYVFKGIAEFATDTPLLITGDNYEEYRGYSGDLYGRVEINIFNISKLNRDTRGNTAGGARIRKLQETLGESYFDYLKALPDLVLLMDESHRYRADAGVKALNELDPLLGLEFTATPFIDKGKEPVWFKNIIYDYPLAKAIEDGFVKDPAVATQKDFNPKDFDEESLEHLKLEDGVRLHEETKLELDTYARQTGRKRVKPFMLVIAKDTTHAARLLETIQSQEFFGGSYAGKVIQIDSTTKKDDEIVESFLKVEHPDEPTEIVIHVNMLKEGWDVNNLYTIVPLRAANARTLIEQSIGRGLRLPYGNRTGVEAVDRLTIVAHDKFQEIIEEANKPDSPVRIKQRFIEKSSDYKKPVQVVARSTFESVLFGGDTIGGGDEADESSEASPGEAPVFQDDIEKEAGRIALEVISRNSTLDHIDRLDEPEIEERVAKAVQEIHQPPQMELDGVKKSVDYKDVVRKAKKAVKDLTIQIPRITIIPKGEVTCGFHSFQLDTSQINQKPVDREILLQYLSDNRQAGVESKGQGWLIEKRPEDFLVRQLIDYHDVSYDDHADLLYDLAGQVVKHLKGYLNDEEAVRNVVQYYEKSLARNIHEQMAPHYWERAAGMEVKVLEGWMPLKSTPNYLADEDVKAVPFRNKPPEGTRIKRCVFVGFDKCLYNAQKFDSDGERRFCEVLENDKEVEKWFKPSFGQFQLFYKLGSNAEQAYEPDFVVEGKDRKWLVEVKRDDELEDAEVLAKAQAGAAFCKNATDHAATHKSKPWSYCLIPDTAIAGNQTMSGLAAKYTLEHFSFNLTHG